MDINQSREVQKSKGMVDLLGPCGTVVGTGVVQGNIKSGMELHGVKLCPFEVAVQVVRVVDESVWTVEILGERLGQCAGLVIRWRRAAIRNVEGGRSSAMESSEGQNFSFPTTVQLGLEFEEEGISNDGSSGPSNPEVLISGAGSTSPNPSPSHSTADRVPVVDGLPPGRQSTAYSMRNSHSRATTLWGRGVYIKERVTLDSVVEAKKRGGCIRNCLRDVDERYILDQRYMAWGQKYELRATWIMQILNAFYQRIEGQRIDKFRTKLDGVEVCNACYAVTVGYSQRHFKQLKLAHRVYGRVVDKNQNRGCTGE
jgi:hypothetical protein